MAKGNILLLLAAAIWGMGYVSQQAGMELLGPWSFTGVRCTLGGLALIPLALMSEKKRKKSIPGYRASEDTLKTLGPAFVCFIFLAGTIMLQQYGLIYTSVGKAGFIASFDIFLVPVIGIFLGEKSAGRIWAAVLVAIAGLFLLTMSGYITGSSTGTFSNAAGTGAEEIGSINKGDILMFISAFAYSFYVHAVDRYTGTEEVSAQPGPDTVKLSCLQMLMTGVLGLIMSAILEPGDITWGNCIGSWIPLVYGGVVSAAGGFTLQMLGQKYTGPAVASLILSMETLFSLLGGWLFFGEILTTAEYAGCTVVMIAILMAVVPGKNS